MYSNELLLHLVTVENSEWAQPWGERLWWARFYPVHTWPQLHCPRPAWGKQVFKSLVLSTPRLEAGPALWCPKGDSGTACVCVKRFDSKSGSPSLLGAAAPSWMTQPGWGAFPLREIGGAYLELRGAAKLTNTHRREGGRASTCPTGSFQRSRIAAGLLPWTQLHCLLNPSTVSQFALQRGPRTLRRPDCGCTDPGSPALLTRATVSLSGFKQAAALCRQAPLIPRWSTSRSRFPQTGSKLTLLRWQKRDGTILSRITARGGQPWSQDCK